MNGNCFVPQGSVLPPLLLTIFLIKMFFSVKSVDIENYADNNMPYAPANDRDSLIVSLEEASNYLFTLFDNKLMKINADKLHFLVSSNEKITINR